MPGFVRKAIYSESLNFLVSSPVSYPSVAVTLYDRVNWFHIDYCIFRGTRSSVVG
jgi:hypothetical protein